MRASAFVSVSAFAAAALAQGSSSTIDPFPQTSFLTQTGSGGVVTGQPTLVTSIPLVVTSQPPVATSQPPVATSVGTAAKIPDLGPGLHTYVIGQGTNSSTTVIFSANVNGSTSYVTPPPTSSNSGAGFTGTDGRVTPTSAQPTGTDGKPLSSPTSPTSSHSTGAAVTMRAVAGSVVGLGAFVAAFL